METEDYVDIFSTITTYHSANWKVLLLYFIDTIDFFKIFFDVRNFI